MNVTSRGTPHPLHRTIRERLASAVTRLCVVTGIVLTVLSGGIGQARAQAPPVDAQAMVAAHNAARAQVGQGPLAWSQAMVDVAEGWARQLENNPRWCAAVIHNSDRPERTGENMYAATVNSPTDAIAPDDVVASWVSEGQYYHLDTNTCESGQECGHYIQVVWGETKELGCASALCHDVPQQGDLWEVIICDYRPGLLLGQKPY